MSAVESSPNTLQTRWDTPLDGAEWDRRFPGIMDGVSLLGGPANVILQLALAPVGYGVAESKVESGSILKRPLKRARTTFTYLSVAMMGTTEEKLAYRRAVNWAHAQVRSESGSKVQYNALDSNLQMWVAACLVWGFMDGYRLLRGFPNEQARRDFYALAMPLGTTLQVKPSQWPADLDAFDAYWNEGLSKLHIDDTIREFLTKIIDLSFTGPVLSRILGPFPRFVTTGFLPPQVRAEMKLSWTDQQDRKFQRFMRVLGTVNRMLPRVLRQFPYNIVMWDFRRRLRKGQPLI